MNGEKEKTGATASTTAVGRRAEELALRFLQAKGYRRLAQNARFGPLEIDLVLQDGETIVFAEVKARAGTGHGTPAEFVTREKRRRLTRAATAYLQKNGLLDRPARFDVLEVYLKSGEVRQIQNAFDAEA